MSNDIRNWSELDLCATKWPPCCRSAPSGGFVHGVHRRDPRALRSAFHERRSGARGRSLWTPVGKPASLAFVLSDRDGADVNRHAKWTRIGIHEGPLSWRIRNDRAESGRCAGQSRPKPRGGTIAWSSVRSRSQIASNASAVALSCRFFGQPGGRVTLHVVSSETTSRQRLARLR